MVENVNLNLAFAIILNQYLSNTEVFRLLCVVQVRCYADYNTNI